MVRMTAEGNCDGGSKQGKEEEVVGLDLVCLPLGEEGLWA